MLNISGPGSGKKERQEVINIDCFPTGAAAKKNTECKIGKVC